MALAIDTKHLLSAVKNIEAWLMDAESGSGGRFQLHRVCVYAVVGVDAPYPVEETIGLDMSRLDLPPFYWQADQDDDLDELEVLHHLKHLAATVPSVRRLRSSSNGTNAATTTLVANVQSPTFSARMQDRPASSFHRFSQRACCTDYRILRTSGVTCEWSKNWTFCDYFPNILLNIRDRHGFIADMFRREFPYIVCANTRQEYTVYWQVQCDYVDLHTPRLMSTQRPGKRRRTLNPFHQVPSRRQEDTSRRNHPPDAKRFNGVRFRADRKRWVAEMKTPGSKNKVSFGDFQSQAEAARVVDVAFHFYGKPLNFADTPQILSTRPPLPELDLEDKLKFVKEQAKWLASVASTLPSSSTSPFPRATSGIRSPVPTPESPRGAIGAPLGFRSFSEISSSLGCGGADEADDGVSQTWLHPNPMTSDWVDTLEPDLAAVDHAAVTTDFGEGQSTLQGSAENATVDPRHIAITANFATGTFPDLVSSPGMEEPGEIRSMFLDFLLMSPPAPAFQVPSPGDFRGELADRLWEEQDNFGYEEVIF